MSDPPTADRQSDSRQSDDRPTDDRPRRRRRAPRKVTADSLHNAALYYLQRFATSAENLRRVLMRRVERSARHHGTDPAEGAALVDALVARFQAAGLLDDAAYAEARVASLRRRGTSARLIRAKLRQKGVDADLVERALDSGEQPAAAVELAAAAALARRRRLGPYRPEADREFRRERDLAALARMGFSYDVARTVIDAESAADLEDAADADAAPGPGE